MLIAISDGIINTDYIVTAENTAKPGYPRQITATLTTGEKVTIHESATIALEDLCGSVVPAPPGLTLIEAFVPTESRPGSKVNYWETVVVAFRVLGGVRSPMPIGLRGEPQTTDGSEYAVIQPDGRCVGWERTWPDREAFVAYCEEEAARNRASLAHQILSPESTPTPFASNSGSSKPHDLAELRDRILAEPIQSVGGKALWRPDLAPADVIDAVRRAHPDLHTNGVGYNPEWGWKWGPGDQEKSRADMSADGNVEAFELALRFLSHAGRQFVQARLNRDRTSYSWKHAAERVMGDYVPNGMLIAAAYALGFKVESAGASPHACINLSEKAVALDPGKGLY